MERGTERVACALPNKAVVKDLFVTCFCFFSSSNKMSDDEGCDGPVKASEYSPEKNYYHPIKHACWKYGER